MMENGDIYWIKVPYYDKIKQMDSYKYRPALIIGSSDDTEYVVLPISRCENLKYKNEEYDVHIKLKEESYIRTHKQTTASKNMIDNFVINIKNDYKEVYDEVCQKYKKFTESLLNGLQ